MSITFSGLKGSKNRLYDNSKTAFAVTHTAASIVLGMGILQTAFAVTHMASEKAQAFFHL
ncbi:MULTISPECIES: hypothetical protein [Acinetobacter]|uniref:Uncharacterized protein n=1 Tax=Acinetobacter towneri TaxID=202956 RepID=A0A1E8DZH4_9GAMM|nr:hypothetical protein [Acinetobacter towneri]OFE42737.1 hypothetical protein BJN41_12540 [Acinetobacter towneri]